MRLVSFGWGCVKVFASPRNDFTKLRVNYIDWQEFYLWVRSILEVGSGGSGEIACTIEISASYSGATAMA
jgi:hypothetical protein